ncbi:MAG: hypothetical protein LBH64_04240 [Coriobacteriales bacterium]|jgi:type II secretory pathway pseudopilin PulG|nr:hypothetical protein [Coriobacteriales bacterium]
MNNRKEERRLPLSPLSRFRVPFSPTAGFTLVELIVSVLLLVLIVAAVGTFLVFGTNLMNTTEKRSDEQTLAAMVADEVVSQLVLADRIELVRVATPSPAPKPASIAKDDLLLYVGSADAADVTDVGYLCILGAREERTFNYFGTEVYGGKKILLDYAVTVRASEPKYFSITVIVRDEYGQDSEKTTRTFQLANATASSIPTVSESASSATGAYYLRYRIPTQALSYTQDGAYAQLAPFSVDLDTNTWRDLSGNGHDLNLVFTDNPSPLSRDALYFDGAEDYAKSAQTWDLSGLDQITLEVCFRLRTATTTGLLFEFSDNWNLNSGSFGATINNNGREDMPGEAHSVARVGGASSAAEGARNFNWPNNPLRFTTMTFVFSRVADPTGRLVYLDGGPPVAFVDTSYWDATYPTTTATTTAGAFGNYHLYFAARAGSTAFSAIEIASIRLYDRKLTADEVAHNAAVDASYTQRS